MNYWIDLLILEFPSISSNDGQSYATAIEADSETYSIQSSTAVHMTKFKNNLSELEYDVPNHNKKISDHLKNERHQLHMIHLRNIELFNPLNQSAVISSRIVLNET